MSDAKIKEMVDQVFIESFEIAPDALGPDKNIFADLGLDSLDIVDLVVALQKQFAVKIRDDERVRNVRTLGDIYSFIAVLKEEGEFVSGEE